MDYKNYRIKIEYNENKNMLVGRIIGIDDIVEFECDSLDKVQNKAKQAVDNYIRKCKAENRKPNISKYMGVSYKLFAKLIRELYEAEDFQCGSISTHKMQDLLAIIYLTGAKNDICVFNNANIGRKYISFFEIFDTDKSEWVSSFMFNEEEKVLSCENIQRKCERKRNYDTNKPLSRTQKIQEIYDNCDYLSSDYKKLCVDVFLNYASFDYEVLAHYLLNVHNETYFTYTYNLESLININHARDCFSDYKNTAEMSDKTLFDFIYNYNL